MLLIAVVVLGGFALYVMTPEERRRLAAAILRSAQQASDRAARRRSAPDAFRDALAARSPIAPVTPVLVIVHVILFLAMLSSPGAISDPESLVGWGGNFGPRTTNGEWTRLVTAMFLHAGLLPLVVNIIGLRRAGLIVERFVGPLAFAVVYLAAGIVSGLQSLSAQPVTVAVGAAGAVSGVYGLLLACVIWRVVQQTSPDRPTGMFLEAEEGPQAVKIPLQVLVQLAPAAGVFVLYHAMAGPASPKVAGLLVGLVAGGVLAAGAAYRKPHVRQIAAVAAASAVLVVGSAVMMQRIADVRPEIVRVVELEEWTASVYDAAVARFKKGGLSADALAKVIDETIVPELKKASARLEMVRGVPDEHMPVVAAVEEYFRLRHESWRLRAEGLQTRNMPALKKAEAPERAALEALYRVAPSDLQ